MKPKFQTLKEQVDEIREGNRLAQKDYWNFGGLGYPSAKKEQSLLVYIAQLERENEQLKEKNAELWRMVGERTGDA